MLKKLDENKSIKESVLPRAKKTRKLKKVGCHKQKYKSLKESGLSRVKKQEH